MAAVILGSAAMYAPAYAGAAKGRTGFDLQAHRGGLGLRSENTLASFGNAIQLGVSTLELDIQITSDGHAVVTHDRRINPAKCSGSFAGQYIKDLTLAQVRTMDCGWQQLPGVPTQLNVPGSRMPLLSEVFALVQRYEARGLKLNIETKVEAGAPHETAPREAFVQAVVADIRKARIGKQVTIQSFDWGALMRLREVEPSLPLVALTNYDFLQTGQPGKSPWLGGLDIDDFGGDPILAIKSFGASAFSPVHGFPQNGTVNDPSYRPYVTASMVTHAHANGIKVVPWTINDTATQAKLMDDGVDGIITDRPDLLRTLMTSRGLRLPEGYRSSFDVQGHRGARAVLPENTLAAFSYAMANPAVSTLELDTGVTRDGHLVVIHDRTINGSHCVDTAPAFPGDPLYPYVGKRVHDLTLAQVRTLDCGSKTLPEFPAQQPVPGAKVPLLSEVFELVRARPDMRLNIETKISPTVADTAPYWLFTLKLVLAIKLAGLTDRVTIQSFDWRTIMLARSLDRRLETVALVWQYGPAECATLADECSLQAVYGDPSVKSPWTGGLDWWRHRDLGKLVRASGASTVSSNCQVHDPGQGTVASPDWYLRENPLYFHGPAIPSLREHGLKVVPYTINDASIMDRLIALGVDGIISDDPDLLVKAAIKAGLR